MKTAEKKKIEWQTVWIVALALISVAVVACTLISIWVMDWRWFATAGVLLLVDFAGMLVASEIFE